MKQRHLKRIAAVGMALLMTGTVCGNFGSGGNAKPDYSISASAAGAVESGTCGTNLRWTFYSTGVLSITGSGKMKDYGYRNAPWYKKYGSGITKITLPNELQSIGDYAFIDLVNLQSISTTGNSGGMPLKLESIGNFAFARCKKLCGTSGTSLIFGKPSDLSSPLDKKITIGFRAFYNCGYISRIVSSAELEIGDYAFQNNSNLKSVDFSLKSAAIGDLAFYECEKLSDVNISLSNKPIHARAFEGTPYDTDGCVQSVKAGTRNVGAASTMTGKILVVNFFVDEVKNGQMLGSWDTHNTTLGSSNKTSNVLNNLNVYGTVNSSSQYVTSSDVAVRLDGVREAMNRLQEQAKLYGQSFTWDMSPATNYYVTCDTSNYLLVSIDNDIQKGNGYNPLKATTETRDYANRWTIYNYIKTITNGSVDLSVSRNDEVSPFTDKLRNEKGYDSVVYLMHNINVGAGRSCAYSMRYNKTAGRGEEWAVIYENSYQTIAHETCHLFGAMDYYPRVGVPDALNDYLMSVFGVTPDIMWNDSFYVSPLTAFSIGWRYNLDKTVYDHVYPYAPNY